MISTCASSLRASSATIVPTRSTAALSCEGDSVSTSLFNSDLRETESVIINPYILCHRQTASGSSVSRREVPHELPRAIDLLESNKIHAGRCDVSVHSPQHEAHLAER